MVFGSCQTSGTILMKLLEGVFSTFKTAQSVKLKSRVAGSCLCLLRRQLLSVEPTSRR